MSDTPTSPTRVRLAPGEMLIAVGMIAFALVVLWQTQVIPVSPLYSKVGPTVAPTLTWMGMLALGLGLLAAAFRGGWQSEDEKETPVDMLALAYVGAGLLANIVLITFAGFTIASVAMFVLVARGFGSRRTLRDAGIALALALTAYFGFAGLLGINIGGGLIENAISSALGFAKV
ncbi:MAG: tripartite tricarboxylate transporter TctB family protein [Hyphomicrobiaceae bacterium]|nr:tripartite tricarboxylate transporter TctB family protein [Hyphomicrobiaceae bacterium]